MLQHLRSRKHKLAAAQAFARLQQPYLDFTKSYIASEAQRNEDLHQLINHLHVTAITFGSGIIDNFAFQSNNPENNVDWMFIGTNHVTIDHRGVTYAIGEFVVYLSRFNTSGKTAPMVLIENVTPPHHKSGGPRNNADLDDSYMLCAHPHCFGEIGMFCMSDGRQEINNALVEGNVLEAFSYIDAALRSYGPDRPYCFIEHWPTSKKTGVEDASS